MANTLDIKLRIFILVFVSQFFFNNSTNKILNLDENDDNLRILYVGNMGVLIENRNQTILIDGFHRKYKPAYAFPSKGMVDSLVFGEYPGFTKLELSLVTHKHKDHFSPELTLQFLRENAESIIIGPDQVKEELAKTGNDTNNFLEQVKALVPNDEINSIEHQGINVKSIKCDHTYQARHKDIQNNAYLIDINGYKILHVGDTEWDLSKDAFNKLNLAAPNTPGLSFTNRPC